MDAEQALFSAFVIRAKRMRYVELLGTKRGRDKVREALDHFSDLDPRSCRKVSPGQDSPDAVLCTLRRMGAPTQCHVISVNPELDGRDMPLSDALLIAIGSGQGTFVSCVDGVLGYFEGEDAGQRYICHRMR
jgi:hypothetical protein